MKHVSMMHACVMHVKNGDRRADGKLNSRSMMVIFLIFVHKNLYRIKLQEIKIGSLEIFFFRKLRFSYFSS